MLVMALTLQESVKKPLLRNVCNSVVEPKIFLSALAPRNLKYGLRLYENYLFSLK
jgi:hypothetical protein